MRHQTAIRTTAAALLAAIALTGCGSSPASSALRDPSTQGVEALRQAIRSALQTNNYTWQCELLAPALLEQAEATIASCAKAIKEIEGSAFMRAGADIPYSTTPSAYTAGGRIQTLGNIAAYMSADGGREVFRAVYTEGEWRITSREQP
jgi:hypothetical protein